MRSWMRSSTAKRTAWILMAAFVWTAVGPQPAHAAVEYCKELRAAALPQARELTDSEMAEVTGGNPDPPPDCPCCNSGYSAASAAPGSGSPSATGCTSCGSTGPTINTLNGNLGLSARASDPPSGRGSIEVDVFYNTKDSATDGPLGKNWRHSFYITLKESPEAGVDVRVTSPKGIRLDFTGDDPDWQTDPDITFTPVGRINCRLEKVSGVYTLWADDSVNMSNSGDIQHIFGPVSSGAANLGQILVPNGYTSDDDYVSSLEYNASGISAVVDGAGNRATFVYATGTNRISYLKYTGDVRTTFTYTANGGYYDLTLIERPTEAGQATSLTTYTYDTGHKMLSAEGGGGTTTYQYSGTSSSGRLTVVIDPLGNRTTYDYTPADSSVAVTTAVRTDPSGVTTTFVNNSSGSILPKYVEDAAGNRTSYLYDAAGRISSIVYKIDGQLCSEAYSYTWRGSLAKIAYSPANTSVVYTYYTDGDPWFRDTDLKSITNENGEVTTFTYDNHRVKTTEDPLHNLTTWVYATTVPGPIRIEMTGEVGVSSDVYTYWTSGGGAGRLKTKTDAVGNVTTYSYDDLGRLVSVKTSPSSGTEQTTTVDYDNWGRIRHLAHPDATTIAFAYDCCHLNSIADENGKLTSCNYYADGSLKVTTDTAGQAVVTSFGWDAVNHKSWRSITNAEGKTVTYTYDARGLLEKLQYADGTSETYSYEESGKVKSRVVTDGSRTTYSYSTRGWLTKIDYPNDADTLFSYDSAGRRTGMADASGSTSYSYYADGYVKATSVTFAGSAFGTKVVSYDYYPDGTKKSMTAPGGGITTYHYDASGRLTWLINSSSEATTYTYDGMSRIVKKSLNNGAYTSYYYNNRSWITDVENIKRDGTTVLSSFSYYYADGASTDYVGNVLKVSQKLSDGNTYTSTYTYDDAYRLIYEGRTGPSAYGYSYTYDKVGNRKSLVVTGDGRTTYSYDLDSNNELDTEWSISTTIAYTYDNRGRTAVRAVTGDGTTTYSYNDMDKLVKANYGATSSTYDYNGEGVRVKRVNTDASVTYFVYDGRNVIVELDSAGNSVVQNTYGPNGLISWKKDASYYAACDGQGSVWNLVTLDVTETVAASYTYTAFGETTTIGTDNTGNPYKYVGAFGYYSDPEGNLLLLGARYYSPNMGRFISMDPIAHGGNWYAYVGSRPTVAVDPDGLFPCTTTKETKSVKDYKLEYSAKKFISEEYLGNVKVYVGVSGGVEAGKICTIQAGGGIECYREYSVWKITEHIYEVYTVTPGVKTCTTIWCAQGYCMPPYTNTTCGPFQPTGPSFRWVVDEDRTRIERRLIIPK